MKIYISGPMRGIQHYNFPAFDRAAEKLRKYGHWVISPADGDRAVGSDAMDCPPDTDWTATMSGFDLDACVDRDIAGIRECDGIYLLPGWRNSTGARAEHALAEWLGKKIMEETVEEVLTELPPLPDPLPIAKLALPRGSAERKTYPLYSGLFQYFPRALCAVAHHSYVNNEKHNPGEPLHWTREKSADHTDCILRHVLEGDCVATAWRALAQLEIELEGKPDCPDGDYKLNPADVPEQYQRVVQDGVLPPANLPPPEYDPDNVAFGHYHYGDRFMDRE